MPITVFQRDYGRYEDDGQERTVDVTERARSPDLLEVTIEETRGLLRQVRGVDPRAPDDFTVRRSLVPSARPVGCRHDAFRPLRAGIRRQSAGCCSTGAVSRLTSPPGPARVPQIS